MQKMFETIKRGLKKKWMNKQTQSKNKPITTIEKQEKKTLLLEIISNHEVFIWLFVILSSNTNMMN